MPELSEQLMTYLQDRGLTPAQLAQRCAIDRSTLYQYLSGKRPLRSREQLDTIASVLQLTPEEQTRLNDAFMLSQSGTALFLQRKKVEEVLLTLPVTEECPVPGFRAEEHSLSPFCPGMLTGEIAVRRTVASVVRKAVLEGRPLKLLLQPELSALMDPVLLFGHDASSSVITHILCLESNPSTGRLENLERLRLILKYGTSIPSYYPLYYYGCAAEHFGAMSTLPGLVLTPEAALQLSGDGCVALLHTDPGIIQMFQHLFSRLELRCRPLVIRRLSLLEQVSLNQEALFSPGRGPCLEICSGLCCAQFWSEHLVQTYLSHSLPQREQLLPQFLLFLERLRKAKQTARVTVLMDPDCVLDFIRTGVFREYPAHFFERPLAPADRRQLLEQMLLACSEGWYRFCFLAESAFPLNHRWELCVAAGGSLLLQYFIGENILFFSVPESGTADAFYDYLHALQENCRTMSAEDSAALLRRWMDAELPKGSSL